MFCLPDIISWYPVSSQSLAVVLGCFAPHLPPLPTQPAKITMCPRFSLTCNSCRANTASYSRAIFIGAAYAFMQPYCKHACNMPCKHVCNPLTPFLPPCFLSGLVSTLKPSIIVPGCREILLNSCYVAAWKSFFLYLFKFCHTGNSGHAWMTSQHLMKYCSFFLCSDIVLFVLFYYFIKLMKIKNQLFKKIYI